MAMMKTAQYWLIQNQAIISFNSSSTPAPVLIESPPQDVRNLTNIGLQVAWSDTDTYTPNGTIDILGSASQAVFPTMAPYPNTAYATVANGSNIMSGVSNLQGIRIGSPIFGTSVPVNTTVLAIYPDDVKFSSSQILMSHNATGDHTGNYSFNVKPVTATISEGSAVLTGVSSTAGIQVGQTISGWEVIPGTTVTAIGTGTVTMSDAKASFGSGVSSSYQGPFVFGPPNVWYTELTFTNPIAVDSGAGGHLLVNLTGFPYPYLKVRYTQTADTDPAQVFQGFLNCTLFGKDSG